MGKVKSGKKGRPATSNQVTPKAGSTSITALEADLASLEEGKRQKACMLLADLYSFNVSNKFSLDALTSSNILSKLSMRLVDTSDKVRVQASSALKNLSESKNSSIVHRLISLGIIRSSVTLCIESVTNANWTSGDGIEFAENLLHTLANAVSCNDSTVTEIISTNGLFLSNIITLINVSVPASIISAVANLLIIIASHSSKFQILEGNPSSEAYQSRLQSIWSFIELLASYKTNGAQNLSALGLFTGAPAHSTKNSSKPQGDEIEQQLFQIKVLMIECLEVVVGVYTSAVNTANLANVCRIGRALQLLNEELHVSLNGIQVTAASSASSSAGTSGSSGTVSASSSCGMTVAVEEDEEMEEEGDATEASSETAQEKGNKSQADPEVLANMRRLGLCKTIAGVVSTMLESLTAETEGAPAATVESNRQKLATVNQALLEQHTYSTLVQCYNAAYYFLTASTAPTTVRAEQRVGGAKAAPGVATGAAGTTTATAMAITPAVVDGFECCDQLASTLSQVFSAAASTHPAQLKASGVVDAALFAQLLQPLLDLVAQTSPVAENTAQEWKAPYFLDQGVTENTFRKSLLSSTAALVDLLAQLAKHAALTDCNGSSPSSAVLTWSEEQLKNLAVLFVRCSSYPNVEVAVPGMLAMAALGQRDFALREATAGAGGLLSPVLNALLTNALLRRLQEPSAYASETAQQNKQMRLLEGSMQAMDSAFNAVIDLHTSDEKVFLANYAKLQCAAKLQERGEFFAQQLHSAAVAKLDQNDLEKFSETLENLESFIKYKTGFV